MLVNFFHVLKDTGVPVTPRELLDLLEAMEQRLAFGDMDDFYSLSRAILVKDEKYYDRFDRAFGLHFQDLEALDDLRSAMANTLEGGKTQNEGWNPKFPK